MSDLWNIILNTIKVNVIDGESFKLLEYHSAKQLFLAVGFYSLRSDFSHRLFTLFIAAFSGLFLSAVWTVVLFGFDPLEIKATMCANTFHECILRRRARTIVTNGKRLPFNATFWNKGKFVVSLLSFAHLIPVEEKRTGEGGGKNLLFRYDDWKGKKQSVSVHLTICKRYCDSWT